MRVSGANFVAGQESRQGLGFNTTSPLDGEPIEEEFFEASDSDIDASIAAASGVHVRWEEEVRPLVPDLLEALARETGVQGDSLIGRAHRETGLDVETRLRPELARTISQLRLFSDLVTRGVPEDARSVAADPEREPTPRPSIRSTRVGIGPVLVVEPANFPLAFGVLGGDTASALAAGCPVVCKAHPDHPGTSELFARIFYQAARAVDAPPGILSLLHGGARVGEHLVRHSLLRGVAFTGSRAAGSAILRAAGRRSRPLDEISLEMGSVNPVFVFSGALASRGPEIARSLAGSMLLGGGQFCTAPGLVFGAFPQEGTEFLRELNACVRASESPTLLSVATRDRYEARLRDFRAVPGVTVEAAGLGDDSPRISAQPTVFRCDVETFRQNATLREEVFGPCAILVDTDDEQLDPAAALFDGELTATIHAEGRDQDRASLLVATLRTRVGRLVFDGMPTGVEVCDAMQHGGPWPAGHGRFTSVGPDSLTRWVRTLCFQNAPESHLPAALLANPAAGA